MNPVALIAFLVGALALLTVYRGLAAVALLAGSIYMTMGQGIEIGSIKLPIYRMLLIVGVVRVVLKGETIFGGLNLVDKMILALGLWLVFAAFFHDWSRYGPIYAGGIAFNITLIYFLIRIWCNNLDDIRLTVAVLALLLVPIALEMMVAKATGRNLFTVFGGVPEHASVREGRVRSQGPFLHAILAGTVGAVCIPLFIGIIKRFRVFALIGIGSGLTMVWASASSGPVMSLFAGVGALALWPYKHYLSKVRVAAVIVYLVLLVMMNRPPYYLMSDIDISGGSTGWHRANLIEMTFKHFSEWWLFGTDATRHWMPAQGIAVDPLHTDITNYYISFAVMGGLLAVLLLIALLWVAFRWVGKVIDARLEQKREQAFMIWCFGASLFSHAVTSLSVAYFDQSMLFFWLSVAVISSAYSLVQVESQREWPDDDEVVEAEQPIGGRAQSNLDWRRKYRKQILESFPAETLAPRFPQSRPRPAADKPFI